MRINLLELFVFIFIRLTKSQLILKPSDSIIFHSNFHPFVTLCSATSNDFHQFSWQSPKNIEIEKNPTERITIEEKSDGLRLRFRNVTEDDRGIWKCLATDRHGRRVSNQFELRVKIPIKFLGDSIHYAKLNSPTLIRCRVKDNPTTEITWLKGRRKLPIFVDEFSSSRYEQVSDGLRIHRVSPSDEDLFICQADQIETGESNELSIQLVLAHEIQNIQIDCLSPCAVEKRAATLICQADGMPKANYSWFYGQNSDIPLSSSSKFVIRENRLILNHVDETDNGRYSCLAKNNFDRIGKRTDFLLRTIIPPELNSILPVEIYLDENSSSEQQVIFTCRLQRGSTESLSLQWFRPDGQPLQKTNEISIDTSRLTIDYSIEFRISPIRREHFGNYSCVAKNLAETTKTIAQLIVRYSPIFVGPQLTELLSVPNRPVLFECQFDSSPPSIIEWIKILRNGTEILCNENQIQVIKYSTRQLTSTIVESQLTYNPIDEDFDNEFRCRSMSSNFVEHSIKLRLADPPDIVRIVRFSPHIDSLEIYLETTIRSNQFSLLRFIVEYEEIDSNENLRTEIFPILSNGSEMIRLESLQAGTTYRIRVAAESEAGRSLFSSFAQCQTEIGQLTNFNLTKEILDCDQPTSCLIQWSIYSDGGSSISHADLSFAKFRKDFRSMKFSKTIEIDAEAMQFRLDGLQSDTSYTVLVRLHNKAGPATKSILIRTQKLCPNPQKSRRCGTGCCSGPNYWVVVFIVILIICFLIGGIVLLIWFRHKNVCCQRSHRKIPQNDPEPNPEEYSTNG